MTVIYASSKVWLLGDTGWLLSGDGWLRRYPEWMPGCF